MKTQGTVIAAKVKGQRQRLPAEQSPPYRMEKRLAIICGVVLGATLCAWLWLWWSEGEIKRKVEGNRQRSIADATATGTFRKGEYENPNAKVNPVGTASEFPKIEPQRRSSTPDGFRSALGRIFVGTALYDVTGKYFGTVTDAKEGKVEVAQASTLEITSTRASVYGVWYDRDYITGNFFVK